MVCVVVSVCAESTQSLNILGFSFLFLGPRQAPWHLVQSTSKVSEASGFPRAAKGRKGRRAGQGREHAPSPGTHTPWGER